MSFFKTAPQALKEGIPIDTSSMLHLIQPGGEVSKEHQ